jgi:hypothetical protein
VTSTASLLACPAADVTLDRILTLVGRERTESLTLEYKEKYTTNVATSVAAMANTYGGLILVGVLDKSGGDRVAGVPEDTVEKIVNSCFELLEPPWQPEVITVPLLDPARCVVVVRVHADRAPRPILIRGAAPIRLHGRNAVADHRRLESLFHEGPVRASTMAPLPGPYLDSGDLRTLFLLRSGLRLPVSDASAWRALSERGVKAVGYALEDSPLTRGVRRWCSELGIPAVSPPRLAGHNRARRLRLVQATSVEGALEVVTEMQLPQVTGVPGSDLVLTLDLVAGGALREIDPPDCVSSDRETGDSGPWRLSVLRLRALLDGMLATLVDQGLVEALAELAGLDSIMVPQPPSLALRTSIDVCDLLEAEGLTPIPGAGSSHGADLVANPALDLRERRILNEQVDDWLEQIGLDAGLSGMQRALEQPRLPPSIA